jgi:NAD(P)-dependent dehydrogenase (short-subunit alcohol dehydrogenase family)
VNRIAPVLRAVLADTIGGPLKCVTFDASDDALRLVCSTAGKPTATGGPLCPDQIVYCNSFPLWFEMAEGQDDEALVARLRDEVASHEKKTGHPAKVVLVKDVGLFAAGDDYKASDTTRNVYLDAIRVMSGAAKLGGISYLPDPRRMFIENWEVEAYRKRIAAAGLKGRATGRIAVVTGGAQGFGLEIAQAFAAGGGHVVLADINVEGARKEAEALCARHGKGRAIGVAVNVADETSVQDGIDQVVAEYGGFDVFVSNAGVLRAGSVKSQPVKDFAFVTEVNYKGYFVCVQKAAPVLALQHKANTEYRGDIIQINSKSGLVGSNRNGAYAGSKFGGIGLTQSFALELVEDGIKVNSICPGNFFDGPLWSDPENGLFAQYLRTGKVPGARTVEDVRKAYEAKVPMGRGCTTADVMKAIFYLMDQQYETGQALPVTGGQVMLS